MHSDTSPTLQYVKNLHPNDIPPKSDQFRIPNSEFFIQTLLHSPPNSEFNIASPSDTTASTSERGQSTNAALLQSLLSSQRKTLRRLQSSIARRRLVSLSDQSQMKPSQDSALEEKSIRSARKERMNASARLPAKARDSGMSRPPVQ